MPPMSKGKRIYTTGQVAEICKVAPRTASRWVDRGILEGYRLPGGGHDRRVPHDILISFMKENGIPVPEFFNDNDGRPLILWVGRDPLPWASARHATAVNEFEVGYAYRDRPDVVVVDATGLGGNSRASEMAKVIFRSPAPARVVIIATEDGFDKYDGVLDAGMAYAVLPYPGLELAQLLGRTLRGP